MTYNNKATAEERLIVYSKTNCPKCKFAKNILTNAGVDFEEINIEQQEEYREYLIDHGFLSLPVTEYRYTDSEQDKTITKFVNGVNPAELNKIITMVKENQELEKEAPSLEDDDEMEME